MGLAAGHSVRHSFHLEPEIGRASGLVHIVQGQSPVRPHTPGLRAKPGALPARPWQHLPDYQASILITDEGLPAFAFRRRQEGIEVARARRYFCSTSFLFTREAGGTKLPSRPPSMVLEPYVL